LGFLIQVFYMFSLAEAMKGEDALLFLLVLAKVLLLIGGLLVMLPMGLADLVVSVAVPVPVTGGGLPPAGERLRQVQALYQQGFLTAEEYETKKRQIVSEI
jgi:hypothetical protein